LEIGNKAKGHGKTAPGKTLLSQNDTSVAVPVSTRKEIAKAAGVSTGQVGNTNASKGKTELSQNDNIVLPKANTQKQIAKASDKQQPVSLTSVRFLLDSIHAGTDLPEIFFRAWRNVWPEPSGNCIFA
jgi:hypothetical protein